MFDRLIRFFGGFMKFVQWHLGIVWVAVALMLTFSALALAGGDDSDPNSSPDQKDKGNQMESLGTDEIGPKRWIGSLNAGSFPFTGPDEDGPREK
jgi:hypothetical protein